MWMIFGIGAILFAIINLICTFNKRSTKWFRFLSLALTALTLCAFYTDGAIRVESESWGTLMDIMPTMSKALWICTSI